MAIQVQNQKPTKLDPRYNPPVKGAFDVKEYIKSVFTPSLRTPLVPNAPVDITLDGVSMTDDDIAQLFINCCDGVVNSTAEDNARELLSQTLPHYNKNTKLLFRECFAVAAGAEHKMDEPSPVIIYTPAMDVIPAANAFISGTMTESQMFATFAYYCRFQAFGAYFVNDIEFENFKKFFQNDVNMIQGQLSTNCMSLIADFMKLELKGLSESFKIRNNATDNLDEFCFARVLINELMAYFQTSSLSGVMPFDAENLFCPMNIVFLNIEKFAHSSPNAVANEVKDINQSIDITRNVPMISNNKLSQLAPVARQLRKSQAAAVNMAANKQAAARAARSVFRTKALTNNQYIKIIMKVLNKMTTEKRTQNIYKQVKPSFAKANRRNPDDYNLQGKIVSTKYRPDLHVYLDTSGSISEENYESTIKMMIQLAKKLNVNLYFNTFSHCMSQTTLLKCSGKSLAQIYAEFQKVPKVTGGTNFEQIWHFINASKKREAEFSLLVTDFEWTAPNKFIKHPKNLYYLPCANMNWNSIKYCAEQFVKSCEHNDPNIRGHIFA